MLRRFEALALVGFLLPSLLSFAHQVTLNNGDRWSRTVVKSDGKTLVLDTDAAGEVALKFEAIQNLKSGAELQVTVKGGKTVVGPVTTNNGKPQIATKTSGTVEAPKEEVTLIRNDAEQQAYEKSLHPEILHGWNGGINIGFSVTRGNRQSENLALAFNAVDPTLHGKIMLYATALDTKNDLASLSTVAQPESGRIPLGPRPRLLEFLRFRRRRLHDQCAAIP